MTIANVVEPYPCNRGIISMVEQTASTTVGTHFFVFASVTASYYKVTSQLHVAVQNTETEANRCT